MQLDEEKLEALRSWGERLRQAGGEESAAVGRAILMLVEEIDRLHIDLWHARMQARDDEPVATDTEQAPIASSLHARLQHALRREPAPPAESPPDPAPEAGSAASPQAWIAALRRQK
ncbi:MAG TPA: hypothetical protein VKO84_12285 [Gaiellaceae bacterium]|nr:hypothetical protein [Gaiellaceae bacterium]